jgi:hypothetical protein
MIGAPQDINFLVPAGAVFLNASYLRLRVSSIGGLAPGGAAPDGEVEDYLIGAGLGDYVWLDVDKDGVQDAAELGVDNVLVELFSVPSGGGSAVSVATTYTDHTGFYEFTGLAPGQYHVKFHKPPYRLFSPRYQGGDPARDSNADTVTGESEVITLQVGEYNTTIDAGVYRDSVLVTLTHFGAIEREGNVVVQWSTGEEFGTIGFIVERLAGVDDWVPINDALIPGALFSTAGRDYELVDPGAAPGATHTYRLVEVENTGNLNVYGPFTVDVPSPTPEVVGMETVSSAPAITDMKAVNGNLILRWGSEAGQTYSIERMTEPGGTPVTVATGVPATPPENVVILVDRAEAGFYRILTTTN